MVTRRARARVYARRRLAGHAATWAALLAWTLALPAPALARQDAPRDPGRVVADHLDDAPGESPEDADALVLLAVHPLDVNTATAPELARIPALGAPLAQAVVDYRRSHGPYGSLVDLLAVPGMTPEVLHAASAFLDAAAPPAAARYPAARAPRALLRAMRHEVAHRMQRSLYAGRARAVGDSTADGETGGQVKVVTRVRPVHRSGLALHLTLEHDAGEPFRWAPRARQMGYDHVSAALSLRRHGRVHALVVGDFSADFGQGLLLSRGAGWGKGATPTRAPIRRATGLRPNGSTNEHRYLRGGALEVDLTPRARLSLFASRTRRDARLAPGGGAIEAFDRSGLHRTPLERSRRGAARERLAGAALAYDGSGWRTGIVALGAHFDPPHAAPATPPDPAALRGASVVGTSLHGTVTIGPAYVFGEAARLRGQPVGALAGVQVRSGRTLEMLLLARHYPVAPASPFAGAFGEHETATNETGLYLALALQPSRRLSVSAYVDHYRFPWIGPRLRRPGVGRDAALHLALRASRATKWRLRVRSTRRDASRPGAVQGAALQRRHSLRADVEHHLSSAIGLAARFDAVQARAPARRTERGAMLSADIRVRPHRRVRLDARWALFDADGAGARLYVYERDLRYVFRVPAFSGAGRRAYLVCHYEIRRRAIVQARIADTLFRNVETIGTGSDHAREHRLREVAIQVLVRL